MDDTPAMIRTIHFGKTASVDFNKFGNVYYFVARDVVDKDSVLIFMDEVDELIRFLQECRGEVEE